MTLATDLLAIGWEPELRGILIVIIAVVALCGSIYLILGHQPRRPPRLPRRPRRARRLDGPDGHHLDDLRHRPEGPGAVVGRRARAHRAAGHRRAVPGRRARRAASRSPRTRRPPRRPRSSPQQFVDEGWTPLDRGGPELRPGGVGGRRRSSRRPGRSPPASSRPSTCSTRRRALPEDRRQPRLPRLLPRAALRRRRGRPARADAHRAGPGPGRRRDRRDPPAPVRVHGPRPRRPAPAGVRADDRRRRSSSSPCAGCCTAASACSTANRSTVVPSPVSGPDDR